MSVEDYMNILDDEISMEIINMCKVSKPTHQIIHEVNAFLNRKYPGIYNKEKTTRIVGGRLAKLEKIFALTFSNGLWKTTKSAMDILTKYFAIG